jgi:hypothetical protein
MAFVGKCFEISYTVFQTLNLIRFECKRPLRTLKSVGIISGNDKRTQTFHSRAEFESTAPAKSIEDRVLC